MPASFRGRSAQAEQRSFHRGADGADTRTRRAGGVRDRSRRGAAPPVRSPAVAFCGLMRLGSLRYATRAVMPGRRETRIAADAAL
jgi:hypothetical protein